MWVAIGIFGQILAGAKMDRKETLTPFNPFVCLLLSVLCSGAILAAQPLPPQCYKMSSTIEYIGKGQFRNQLDSFYTVKKECEGERVSYQISQRLSPDSKGEWEFAPMNFMVDKSSQRIFG